jgi:hypothetical protein
MVYDLSKSISQRSSREKDEENIRIKEIANEISRCCELYETEHGTGKGHVTRLDVEQHVSEQFAKSHDCWIPLNDIFDLGVPGPSGNENETYYSEDTVFKVNNLLNSGGIVNLLNRIILHNTIFPETFYFFVGFAGYNNRSVMPVLKQDLIKNSVPATSIEIDTYMSAIGFSKLSEGRFQNDLFLVWDVVPRNVLKDKDGDIYVIDAEMISIK